MENLEFFSKNYPGGFFSYNADEKGEFVFISDFLLKMLGYTEEEFRKVTGNRFNGFIYPPDLPAALKKINQEAPCDCSNAYDSCSYRVKKKDGALIWLHDEGHLVTLKSGKKLYFVVVVDISDYKRVLLSQTSLISCIRSLSSDGSLKSQIKSVLDSVYHYYEAERCILSLLNPDGKSMSNAYERCVDGLDSTLEEVQNVPTKDFRPLLDALDRHNYLLVSEEEMALDPTRKKEHALLKKYSITTALLVPLKIEGKVMGFLAVDNPHENVSNHSFLENIAFFVYDALQKHELHDRLVSLSLRDELTGLPNRYCYDQLLEEAKGNVTKNVGVLFADLNGLKYINDHFGHHYGDQYLQSFAKSCAAAFGKNNVFRISGDEFVIIIKNVTKGKFMARVASLEEDSIVKGFEISSFGAVYYERSSNLLSLVMEAETIMYDKKKIFHLSRLNMKEEDKEEYYRKRFPFLPC